ncbi:hypothetical protein G7046_g9022 [Stylonectria norvegica]|nr:hypothetical protein G7046_g9022 [Stylonectria norvegica]
MTMTMTCPHGPAGLTGRQRDESKSGPSGETLHGHDKRQSSDNSTLGIEVIFIPIRTQVVSNRGLSPRQNTLPGSPATRRQLLDSSPDAGYGAPSFPVHTLAPSPSPSPKSPPPQFRAGGRKPKSGCIIGRSTSRKGLRSGSSQEPRSSQGGVSGRTLRRKKGWSRHENGANASAAQVCALWGILSCVQEPAGSCGSINLSEAVCFLFFLSQGVAPLKDPRAGGDGVGVVKITNVKPSQIESSREKQRHLLSSPSYHGQHVPRLLHPDIDAAAAARCLMDPSQDARIQLRARLNLARRGSIASLSGAETATGASGVPTHRPHAEPTPDITPAARWIQGVPPSTTDPDSGRSTWIVFPHKRAHLAVTTPVDYEKPSSGPAQQQTAMTGDQAHGMAAVGIKNAGEGGGHDPRE